MPRVPARLTKELAAAAVPTIILPVITNQTRCTVAGRPVIQTGLPVTVIRREVAAENLRSRADLLATGTAAVRAVATRIRTALSVTPTCPVRATATHIKTHPIAPANSAPKGLRVPTVRSVPQKANNALVSVKPRVYARGFLFVFPPPLVLFIATLRAAP